MFFTIFPRDRYISLIENHYKFITRVSENVLLQRDDVTMKVITVTIELNIKIYLISLPSPLMLNVAKLTNSVNGDMLDLLNLLVDVDSFIV